MLKEPSRTLLCPYCFQQPQVADCPVVAPVAGPTPAATKKALNGDGMISQIWKSVRRIRFPFRASSAPAQSLVTRKCPYCSSLLPHRLDDLGSEFVGIVGGSFSGKSHYIASLVKQIEQDRALDAFGCMDFYPLVPKLGQDYVQRYYAPLYQRKEVIPEASTVAGFAEPLVYVLVFQRKNMSPRMKRVNLILLDVAGDDLLDAQAVNEQIVRYIAGASGLIFLVDPFTLPALAEWIPIHLRQERIGPQGFRILDAIAYVRQHDRGGREGLALSLPMAITVTKSDLLRYVIGNAGTRPAFLSQPNYASGYQAVQFPQVNEEVKEVLRCYGGEVFLAKSALFRQTGYFAVSATGCAPDCGKHPPQFRFVQPTRCIDPLIWLLIQLKVIEAAESRAK